MSVDQEVGAESPGAGEDVDATMPLAFVPVVPGPSRAGRSSRRMRAPAVPEPPTEVLPAPPAAIDPPTEVLTAPAEAGPEAPTQVIVLPRVSTDPLDELVDRLRPQLSRAVDALQVAAALEADGFTDRIARVEYGCADNFALADEVFRRLGPQIHDRADPDAGPRTWRTTVRLLAHGPLYALPSAVFPAVLGVLGQRSVVLALTVASGLGWMYAGTVAYAAYRLLGSYRPAAAARVLRVAAFAAPAVGAAGGLAVIVTAGGDAGLVVLAAGLVGYQVAGTVLVFYRREVFQAVAMIPALLAGLAFLVVGTALEPVALATAVAGVAGAYGAALWSTRGRGAGPEAPARPLLRADLPRLAGVTCYGLLSAVLLLHAEAPYLLTRLDIAVAVAPLIFAMGFVEWRAERFRGAAVTLTKRSHSPGEFGRRMWLLVTREAGACLAVAGLLGLALLAVLAGTGRFTGAAAAMVAAHVVLGGAYYCAFLLAGFERFGWLCASMVTAIVIHVGAGVLAGVSPLFGGTGAPLIDTMLYLGSVLALLGLFLLGLAPILGQVRHHR
jgi:hypothetical protein